MGKIEKANEGKNPVPQMANILEQNRRRLLAATKASRPLTGIYWWIPMPAKGKRAKFTWAVQPIYAAGRKNDLEHVKQWPHVLAHLASIWGRPLRAIGYAALPRGRVNYPYKKNIAVLYHGKDSPGSLELVKSAFNLSAESAAIYDDHERQIPEEYRKLVSLLGGDLGLKPALEDAGAGDDFTDDDQDSEQSFKVPVGNKTAKKKTTPTKSPTKKPATKANIPKRPEEDRRARQAARLATVMKIQEHLLGRGQWNVRNLAEEMECSEKTIQRHLAVLEMAGLPFYYDAHEKCYRVRPGFKFPVVNLTPDELLGQATATAVMKAAGLDVGAAAAPATRKLAAASSNEVAELLADAEAVMSVFNLKLADHSRHQETIRTVQWALIEGKQVTGQYCSPYQEKPVRLAIHPYRLCLINQAWYLIGRAMDDTTPKTYRIARFQSLHMIDFPVERPERFDLEKFFGNAWAVFRGRESYDIQLEFTKDAAPLVLETVWHKTQEAKRLSDGRAVLNFKVDGLDEVVWWVLSWSSRVKVIKPEKLRQMVLEKLKTAIDMNAG